MRCRYRGSNQFVSRRARYSDDARRTVHAVALCLFVVSVWCFVFSSANFPDNSNLLRQTKHHTPAATGLRPYVPLASVQDDGTRSTWLAPRPLRNSHQFCAPAKQILALPRPPTAPQPPLLRRKLSTESHRRHLGLACHNRLPASSSHTPRMADPAIIPDGRPTRIGADVRSPVHQALPRREGGAILQMRQVVRVFRETTATPEYTGSSPRTSPTALRRPRKQEGSRPPAVQTPSAPPQPRIAVVP